MSNETQRSRASPVRSSRLADLATVLPELLIVVLCFLGMTIHLPG